MSLIQPQSSQGLGFLFGGDDEPNISEPLGWGDSYSDWDMWFDSYFGGSGFGSEGGEYWGDPFGLGWYDLGDGYWYDPATDSVYYVGDNIEDIGYVETIQTSESGLPTAQTPDLDLPWWGYEPDYDWWPGFNEGIPPPPPMTYPNIPACPPGTGRGARGAGDMECTPFSERTPQERQRRQQNSQQADRRAAQQQQQRGQQQCKTGEYFSLKQQKCLPIPRCPAGTRFNRLSEQCECATQGTVFDQRTNKCVRPTRSQLPQKQGQGLLDLFKKMPFPMWIILALIIALMLSGNKGSGTTTTITKRKAR